MQSLFLQPYSLDLLDEGLATTDACVLPQHLWSRWTEHQTIEVLLVEIVQLGETFVLHVASHHNENRDGIFLPQRVLSAIDATEYVEVKVLSKMPPLATKIVLQPLDEDIASYVDVSTVVSEQLSKWHTLKQGTILSIECENVGGLILDILVKITEPAELVLLRGEVPLEIETTQEQVPPSPQPLPQPLPQHNTTSPLAEASREEEFSIPLPQVTTTGFVPFSGKGYRLDGST
jgi:hypothetical protein